MNRLLRSPLVSRAVSSFCLLLLVIGQIIPLRAESWPTQWSFERLENSSSEWWHSLRVQTVPGVLYHLQQSETLDDESWTSVETTYGSGEEWICPLMQGDAPAATPPAGQAVIPPVPTNPIRIAYLIIEKTETGGTLVSWWSLDDHTPKRMLLSGVALDPVWDEFDAPYFNRHGNFFFALCPNRYRTVSFTESNPTLGTLDAAMIAEFTSSLAAITSNISQSVANAALFSHQPQPTGARKFYRIAADWSLDSDGDGRLDWQELVIDGNNPFAADSDGDGALDAPGQGGGASSAGYPVISGSEEPTPVAHIQQRNISAQRTCYEDSSGNDDISVSFNWTAEQALDEAPFRAAGSFQAIKSLVDPLTVNQGQEWDDAINSFSALNSYLDGSDGSSREVFEYTKAYFRLRLDKPAPAGGYEIPLRIALFHLSCDPASWEFTPAIPQPAGTNWIEMTLRCAEGQTVGEAVEVRPGSNLDTNTKIVYIPGCLTTREADIIPVIDDVSRVDLAYPGPIDQDGACIITGNSFVADFGNPYPELINNYVGEPVKIHWWKRQLAGGGTLGQWKQMKIPGWEELPYEGKHVALMPSMSGIYQLQARLLLPGGIPVEFPFVRLRNAKAIVNGKDIANNLLKAGQPDYFGVCLNAQALAVRDGAVPWLGSTAYRKDANWVATDPSSVLNPDTRKSPKCNIFVTHVANQVGAATPYFQRYGGLVPSAPIAKDDWYTEPEGNIDLDGPGWRFQGCTDSPSPGMSIASPKAGGDANSGHVGILDYDGSWINAGKKTVNKSVHLLDDSQEYKPNTMRAR